MDPMLDLLQVHSLRQVAAEVSEVLDYFQGLSLDSNLRRWEGHIHGEEQADRAFESSQC